ncbi:PLP-dependent transferase [Ramaria rubella]|nr:PLP-dependent transferase [Ramaria rubella]
MPAHRSRKQVTIILRSSTCLSFRFSRRNDGVIPVLFSNPTRESLPNMISLLAGKPNPATFPFTSISFTARSPMEPFTEVTYDISGDSLSTALQYSAARGLFCLIEWVTGLQEYFHGRKKGDDWRISMGAGSQDLLYKAFHALVDRGDPVLVETPVYAGIIPVLQSLHANLIEVKMDADGPSSISLRNILDGWPVDRRKPRILYTVPCGSNPSGTTTTLARRLEILEIVREHNIFILEDDPYYCLYFGSSPRPPSYFSLEAQDGGPTGIVLRFDSFSKILSSGLRIGMVTGPVPLLNRIDMHTSISNTQVSSLTQMLTYTLLSSWGYDGFRRHTEAVSELYRAKRDVFENAMRRHLNGLADWVPPEAGLFFWFKIRLPPTLGAPEGDSDALIRTKALEQGVLALPGTAFLPNGTKTAYARASFSLLDEEQVNEALKRLAQVIRAAQVAHLSML